MNKTELITAVAQEAEMTKKDAEKAGQSIARQYIIRQNGKARQTICKKAEYAYRAKADCKVKQIPHG